MVVMPYDRFGRAVPTPRDRPREVPGRLAVMVVCVVIVGLLGLFAWLGSRESKEVAAQRHDSLAPTYTCDGEIIRWYVLVDPDTGVQYLVNDRGGCTPRLTKCGKLMRTEQD